jgi:hypothetical protein
VHLNHDNTCEEVLQASQDGEACIMFQADEQTFIRRLAAGMVGRVFAGHKVEVPLELIEEPHSISR